VDIAQWASYLRGDNAAYVSTTILSEPRESLEEHYAKIREENELGYYISNDIKTLRIKQSPKYPNHNERRFADFYRVTCFPGYETELDFEFKFYYQFKVGNLVLSYPQLVAQKDIELSVDLDTTKLTIQDATYTEEIHMENKTIAASLDRHIRVKSYQDVSIKFNTLVLESEKIEIMAARYPTRGSNLILEHDPVFRGSYQWVKTNVQLNQTAPVRHFENKTDTGFQTYTNNWLLAGEGIVLTWYK
jgi:hypothetical protein